MSIRLIRCGRGVARQATCETAGQAEYLKASPLPPAPPSWLVTGDNLIYVAILGIPGRSMIDFSWIWGVFLEASGVFWCHS